MIIEKYHNKYEIIFGSTRDPTGCPSPNYVNYIFLLSPTRIMVDASNKNNNCLLYLSMVTVRNNKLKQKPTLN
jgi:hypothetical protein